MQHLRRAASRAPDRVNHLDSRHFRLGWWLGKSKRAYLEDVRRFNGWRAGRPITKSLVEEYLQALASAKTSPAYISPSLAGIRW